MGEGLAAARDLPFERFTQRNRVDLGDFDSAATTDSLNDWWWNVLFVVLAVVGIAVQFTDVERRRATMREAWATGVSSPS